MEKQKNHKALKEIARKILVDMGYPESDIKEEYWVGDSRCKKAMRVDVVGIGNTKVAIECGFTSGEKIAALKLFFDDVIVLPYFTLNFDKEYCERRIRELEIKVSQLREQNTKLLKENRSWEFTQARLSEAVLMDIANVFDKFELPLPYYLSNKYREWKRKNSSDGDNAEL